MNELMFVRVVAVERWNDDWLSSSSTKSNPTIVDGILLLPQTRSIPTNHAKTYVYYTEYFQSKRSRTECHTFIFKNIIWNHERPETPTNQPSSTCIWTLLIYYAAAANTVCVITIFRTSPTVRAYMLLCLRL